jgi:hypothetical protein
MGICAGLKTSFKASHLADVVVREVVDLLYEPLPQGHR